MAAHTVFHGPLNALLGELHPLLLGLAACAYFVVNTVLVAGVIALTERKSIYKTWYHDLFLDSALPSGRGCRGVADRGADAGRISWHAALVLFPLVYFVYRSYRMYLDRLEKDKTHVEEIAGLHLRTIEALALAIEAKDTTTARPSAARPRLCDRDRQGNRSRPERTGRSAGGRAAARHRQAGGARNTSSPNPAG